MTEQTVEPASTELDANVIGDLVDFEPGSEDDAPATTPAKPEPTEEPQAKAPELETPKPEEPKLEEKKPAVAAEPAKPVEQPKPVEPDVPKVSAAEVRRNTLSELEKHFELPKEEAELLATEPEKIMPKLMARGALWAYEALYYVLGNQIPTVVNNVTTTAVETRQREDQFYSRWPELKDPKFVPQLAAVGKFWRDQNPTATREQAIEGIGKMALTMLGIEPAQKAPEPKPAKVIPPSTPARASGASAKPTPAAMNPFAELAMWEPEEE